MLSSRIHLKQRNATCEDELTVWAEPFLSFAHLALKESEPNLAITLVSGRRKKGFEYPVGHLRQAWKHLLENHPHDSIGGCSIHQDMTYRFDQSFGIASYLSATAIKGIALASAPRKRADGSLVLALFNATGTPADDPIAIDIPSHDRERVPPPRR